MKTFVMGSHVASRDMIINRQEFIKRHANRNIHTLGTKAVEQSMLIIAREMRFKSRVYGF